MIIKARNERADIKAVHVYIYVLYILRQTRAVNSTVSDYIYFFLYKFKRNRINSALERVGTVFIDDLGLSALSSEIWAKLILI